MKSNIFDTIKIQRPKQSVFDLSHERKTTANMGNLIPILCEDILPGDKFTVNSEIMMRVAPMIAPVMHRVNVYTHFFSVPVRLVWNEFQEFITGGEDGQQDPGFPKLTLTEVEQSLTAPGSLADHLGLPDLSEFVDPETQYVSALPFRAYQMIYNEYYRDQNLTEPVDFEITSDNPGAPERARLMTMRKRAWEKDYFTSALPWAQRGVSAGAPVDIEYLPTSKVYQDDGSAPSGNNVLNANSSSNMFLTTDGAARVENLAEEISLDINSLRTAIKLQEWLEKNARGGSRYVEQIFSHFGVRSSDARLQRPEYLGGGKQPVVMSEVLNTSATATQPQGAMAGHGISVGNSNTFSKTFEEHCIVIGIMSILPRTAYQQGLERKWTKFDKFDWYFPEFANMGEQAILNQEIYFDGNETGENEETWGYQQRFAEYKYKQSSVHGDFKDTLEFWHLGRKFDALPTLDTSFIEADPSERIFAVLDEGETDKFWCQIYNRIKAVRPIPYYNIPSILP